MRLSLFTSVPTKNVTALLCLSLVTPLTRFFFVECFLNRRLLSFSRLLLLSCLDFWLVIPVFSWRKQVNLSSMCIRENRFSAVEQPVTFFSVNLFSKYSFVVWIFLSYLENSVTENCEHRDTLESVAQLRCCQCFFPFSFRSNLVPFRHLSVSSSHWHVIFLSRRLCCIHFFVFRCPRHPFIFCVS